VHAAAGRRDPLGIRRVKAPAYDRTMPSRALRRPDPPPLETDDVHVVAVGTGLWGIGLVVLVVLRLTDRADVRDWWLWMCGIGVVLGLVGVRYCQRRRAALARDAALGVPRRD
jgi:hypothetical protein